MRLLLLGATGLVGGGALTLALAEPRVSRVIAPSRRPLAPHPKLDNPVIDFDRIPADAEWWKADGAMCALGTTRAIAGSAEAFRRIDHDMPLALARIIRSHGTDRFAIVTSMGADPNARLLYPRTKGELEQDLRQCGFSSLTILRPGLLLGPPRAQRRPLEAVFGTVLRRCRAVIPKRYRPVASETVAALLVDAILSAPLGTHVIENDAIVGS
jgi:uncharacterized protein YbjT (DUF2867 family)